MNKSCLHFIMIFFIYESQSDTIAPLFDISESPVKAKQAP